MKHFTKEEVKRLLKEDHSLDLIPEGTILYYCGPNREAIPGWRVMNDDSCNHKIMIKIS